MAGPDGAIGEVPSVGDLAVIHFRDRVWQVERCWAAVALLELYLPLCAAAATRQVVVAHLGQSLDGHTATSSGDSSFVTGPGNLDHLHRMRALSDAIVVGAGTVAADDPRLTTRRVAGPSPTRVVIDPDRRLAPSHRVFGVGSSPTLVLAAASGGLPRAGRARPSARRCGEAEVLVVPRSDSGLDLRYAIELLAGRGLNSLFVEGGGRTVSTFVSAGVVDRLQIAVAPLLTGSGRRALELPPRDSIAECLHPASRLFAMGRDVLFDCDLRAAEPAAVPADRVQLPTLISRD